MMSKKLEKGVILTLGFSFPNNLQSGGPVWKVEFGRGDSLSASKAAAQNNIPAPNSTVAILVSKFQNLGLSLRDMVALSGDFGFHLSFIYSGIFV